MRTSYAIRGAVLAGVILAATACTATVARIEHQWGSGPAPADEERPVRFEGDEDRDTLALLPLRVRPDTATSAYVGSCTVRGVWVDRSQREQLLQALSDSIRADTWFNDPQARELRFTGDSLFFEPGLVQPIAIPVRIHDQRLPETRDDPEAAAGRGPIRIMRQDDRAPPEALESLLVQLWLGSGASAPSCEIPQPPPPEVPEWNLYLVDFEEIYPAGGATAGGAAWVVGVVGIAALVALVSGP